MEHNQITELKHARNTKDRVFRLLFREKKELLSLYNAVNNTSYDNPDDLTVTTLENAIYITMKNDLSFLLYDNMMLYEHQSTDNPNIPLRDLFYVSSLYSGLVPPEKLYSSSRQLIPEPKFIVFYNGTARLPERFEYKLSDLYETRNIAETQGDGKSIGSHSDCAAYPIPDLELKVSVLNINEGYNTSIKDKCEPLKGYSIFVDKTRKYRKLLPTGEAVERAINECISEGILAEFLQKNRAEVLNVSIFEFDEEKYREVMREDGFNLGFSDGKAIGLVEGKSIGLAEGKSIGLAEGKSIGLIEGLTEGRLLGAGEERENGIRLLIRTCRSVNISRQNTLEQLATQYSLDTDTAQKYLNMHWN